MHRQIMYTANSQIILHYVVLGTCWCRRCCCFRMIRRHHSPHPHRTASTSVVIRYCKISDETLDVLLHCQILVPQCIVFPYQAMSDPMGARRELREAENVFWRILRVAPRWRDSCGRGICVRCWRSQCQILWGLRRCTHCWRWCR